MGLREQLKEFDPLTTIDIAFASGFMAGLRALKTAHERYGDDLKTMNGLDVETELARESREEFMSELPELLNYIKQNTTKETVCPSETN